MPPNVRDSVRESVGRTRLEPWSDRPWLVRDRRIPNGAAHRQRPIAKYRAVVGCFQAVRCRRLFRSEAEWVSLPGSVWFPG